jgi:hypothetical protein
MVERLRYIAETDDARFGGIRETLFDAISLLEQMVEREWVGLTDEDIKDIVGRNDSGGIGAYTREMFKQIEDKLREKNR